MRTLSAKTAVITGAGSGIGRALARQLASEGMHTALVDLHEERLLEVEKEVEGADRRVSHHTADVRDEARMAELVEEILEAHGGVDLLVNNAGVTSWGSFEDMSLDDIRWVMDINFWGVVYGCKFFLPHLKTRPEAHIVNVSSIFGVLAAHHQAAYCASKFAVRGFSESLDAELADSRVGVTVVHPGGVSTRFVSDSRSQDAEAKSAFQQLVADNSMGPEKVATAIVKGVKDDRLRVLVGAEARPFDYLKRAFPTWGQRQIARFLAKHMP